MAKRKRLSPAQGDYLLSPGGATAETRTMPFGPAPIAQVAGEAAASAALDELAAEMSRAREEGRLIVTLDTAAVDAGYLVRDRLAAEDDELTALVESLRARGQQTPIEVVALDGGRFGLISGWRRLTALRRLAAETGEARFGRVKALIRRPETAAEAYVAMVEENEIRVGLSYYERARVAAKAVEQGVFETEKAALLHLYATASRAKRSKIRAFLALYHAADDVLRFPAAIGERLGLAVAKALDGGPGDLRRRLAAAAADSPETEQEALRSFAAARRPGRPARPPRPETTEARGAGPSAPAAAGAGVFAAWDGDRLSLTGPGLTPGFRRRLMDWIRQNSGG